jgi:Protein of unknown function (DUF1549)
VELPLVMVFAKLKRLNIRPSADPSDSEFLRRVYIDTIGLLPPEAEARAFFDSRDPARRANLIDRLLDRPEFAELRAIPLRHTALSPIWC